MEKMHTVQDSILFLEDPKFKQSSSKTAFTQYWHSNIILKKKPSNSKKKKETQYYEQK